ncbi:MAG: hypothetical protein JWN04_6377 [Myxococcaceae bacterium]|nr:hypothetical protein [Myxococcaceae bacterium]
MGRAPYALKAAAHSLTLPFGALPLPMIGTIAITNLDSTFVHAMLSVVEKRRCNATPARNIERNSLMLQTLNTAQHSSFSSPKLASRFAYGRHAKIHSSTALSLETIASVAPSVFAESAHESRSARYAYIPTSQVLRGLMDHGFQPFFAVQATTRTAGNEGHTKHMLRLRHADQIAKQSDDVNEVILINSHNGSSSYQMLAGCFRFVCQNGLICGTTTLDVRVKHAGASIMDDVIGGAFSVLDSFHALEESKDAMKSVQLTTAEQNAFARAALAVRFETAEKEAPITPEQVITPRRAADEDNSLWTTFQRAQENLVQGGIRTTDRRRRTRTRAVRGIDGNVQLNRGLWVLAEEMRKLRST